MSKHKNHNNKSAAATDKKTILFPDGIDWQEYYSQCRESCHQYCAKTLTLIFQFTSFSVASISITALLYEKINKVLAFTFSLAVLFGLLYFLLMIVRYYEISRVSSQVCQDIEKEYLFGKDNYEKFGVLSAVVNHKSGFFSSDRMEFVVKMYISLLALATLIFSIALFKFCFADIGVIFNSIVN